METNEFFAFAFTDRRHSGLIQVGRQLQVPAPFADLLLRRSPNLFRAV